MTIEEFIEARLIEEEAIAKAIPHGNWRSVIEHGAALVLDSDNDTVVIVGDERENIHIARHDPARVLRQCAYARSVLDGFRVALDARESRKHHARNAFTDGQDAAAVMWLAWSLQGIASFWSDHPDYLPEWRADQQ